MPDDTFAEQPLQDLTGDGPSPSSDQPATLHGSGNSDNALPRFALGIIGAVVGGTVGVIVFGWILRQGFYGLILPGLFVGLGCQLLARMPCRNLGIFCGAFSFPLSLFAEWSERPFSADGSLHFFLTHLHELQPLTWIMIVAGIALAYFDGKGRAGRG